MLDDDNMGVDAPQNLWQKILSDFSIRTKLPIVNLLVIGDHESGKTALLTKLKESSPTLHQAPPPQSGGSISTLEYTTINIMDPKALKGGGAIEATDAEDIIAKIGTWIFNELKLKELMQTALKANTLQHTVVALVLDLAKPWTIKGSFEKWMLALEGELLPQINQLHGDKRSTMYGAIQQHLLSYEEPGIDRTVPKSLELPAKKEFLEEGVLTKNLGIPVVIVVAKADLRQENSVKMDYIEYVLRQVALKYGAALFYTSAKTGTNCELLKNYILHRAFPTQFKFETSPQLVERQSILIPAGYDSLDLIEKSLVGSQPRWSNDRSFEKMVPVPEEATDENASLHSDIKVDSHEKWLETLEKAAGAGLEELQKQSIEASKKADEAAAARRAAAEKRQREEKDVSSKHLANFFNNLLSRPEKGKSGRGLGLTPRPSGPSTAMGSVENLNAHTGTKKLAEQELQNLSKPHSNSKSGET